MPDFKDHELEVAKLKLLWPLAYPRQSKNIDLTNFIKKLVDDDIIQTGQLFEKAISVQCKLLRESSYGKDFANGDDAKLVSVRTHGHGKTYSAPVNKIHNKRGWLLVAVYERKQQNWFYFRIPYRAYKHIPKTSNIDIPFEADGTPRRKNNCSVNWWKHEVSTFKELSRNNG